jgi:pilus assembly protein CpaB
MKAVSNISGSNRIVRKIRVRAIMFLILALVAGVGAVMLVKNYLDRMKAVRAAAPSATVKVVVAAIDIPIGTPLTKQQLATTSWPVKHVPNGAFGNPSEVLDRTVQQTIVKGEPILKERLADEKAGRGLTAILAKGTRAMAVKVNQVVGVAGFVKPGDYVDVIVTMSPDEESKRVVQKLKKAARVSKIFLQNIKVLAVGQHMATQGTKPVKVQVVTLEVNPIQSERLALASRHGSIQLTMRSRVDQDSVPTSGITPIALLSPDEGSEEIEPAQASSSEKSTERWMARRRRRRVKKVEVKEPKPKAPVVEVLRGNRIEQRKLRPTADSQQ